VSGLSTLEIGGASLQVRREFSLAARIEERFGPLRSLIDRMGRGEITMREIADLYEIALAGQSDPPARDRIEAHVVKAGVAAACAPLAELVSALFIGHERFEAMRKQRAQAGNGAISPDPMMAASRGAS